MTPLYTVLYFASAPYYILLETLFHFAGHLNIFIYPNMFRLITLLYFKYTLCYCLGQPLIFLLDTQHSIFSQDIMVYLAKTLRLSLQQDTLLFLARTPYYISLGHPTKFLTKTLQYFSRTPYIFSQDTLLYCFRTVSYILLGHSVIFLQDTLLNFTLRLLDFSWTPCYISQKH